MKYYSKSLTFTLLTCLITLIYSGCSTNNQTPEKPDYQVNRFPVEVDDKWGYINRSGEMVISPQFDEAAAFSDNWAWVEKEEQIHFIDTTGKIVFTPEYEIVHSFSEGLAPAKENSEDLFGYINKKGEQVIEPSFDQAFGFSEGLAPVSDPEEGKFGYIDKTGSYVIEPQFDGARHFSGGLAPAQTGGFVDGKWGYIDTTGTFVIEQNYKEALPFSEGLAPVAIGEEFDEDWGFINQQGDTVISHHYEAARPFSNGIAVVEGFRDWEFIDKSDESVLSEEYDFAEPFRSGLARVTQNAGSQGMGHRGGPLNFSAQSSEWMYINREGVQVWPEPPTPAESPTITPPEGYTAINLNWPSAYLAVAYPEQWTATDMHSLTRFFETVSIMKSKKAANELYGEDYVASSDKKIRLVTSDNAIINVTVAGTEASAPTLKSYLDNTMSQALVNNPEVVHEISEVETSFQTAFSKTVSGTDEDGKETLVRQLAMSIKGQVVTANIIMPSGNASELEPTIEKVISSIKVNFKNN